MKEWNLTHLTEPVAKFVYTANKKDRILNCKKPKWFEYKTAHDITKELTSLMNYPKINRAPCRLLIGNSNNGKSELLSRLCNNNLATIKKSNIIKPIVMIQAPNESDEKHLYNEILYELNCPSPSRENVQDKKFRVIKIMNDLNVKMLIIDEFHNLLSGSGKKHRVVLNSIRTLTNTLKIPIIGAGIPDAAIVVQSDAQLANRFEPLILPDWKKDSDDFKKLLIRFSETLPLKKPSNLFNTKLFNKIAIRSSGLIGEISNILQLSAIQAIETGEERITEKIIDNIPFVPPYDRRNFNLS